MHLSSARLCLEALKQPDPLGPAVAPGSHACGQGRAPPCGSQSAPFGRAVAHHGGAVARAGRRQ
eukprot:11074934-Alexandrium_andersonii.AAC.1